MRRRDILFGLFAAIVATANATSPSSEERPLRIDLPTTLELAGARNLDIQIARERVNEAAANREAALLLFAPVLHVGIGYTQHDNFIQDITGNVIPVDKKAGTAGATLDGEVDLGDALYKNLAARQFQRASEFGLASERQNAVYAAAIVFFELAKAQSAETVFKASLAISEDYLRQLKAAVSAGIAFKGDQLRAEVQVENDQLAIRRATEQRQRAGARLIELLHLDPAIELNAVTAAAPLQFVSAEEPLKNVLTRAFACRPELKQRAAELAAAKDARNGALYGPLFPTVQGLVFTGGIAGGPDGGESHSGSSQDYQATLGWKIGPGGLFDFSRIDAATAKLAVASANSQKTADAVGHSVAEGYYAVHSLTDQITILTRQIHAAKETLRLAMERKEFAVGNVLETIQSAQDLERVRLQYVEAIAELNISEYTLLQAVGATPNEHSKAAARPPLR